MSESENASPSASSLRGLDALNFFMPDVRDGYLKGGQHWQSGQIGIAMAASSVAAALCQIPAGMLVDGVRVKRLLVAVSGLMVAGSGFRFSGGLSHPDGNRRWCACVFCLVHARNPTAKLDLITMRTVLLLFCSNTFMTIAWYGHLKYGHSWPMWKAIAVSWLIAFVEYCFAVPANRLGFGEFSGFQLKIIQEAVTLIVFVIFATTFLKEKLAWNYLVAFCLIALAAFFAFAFKSGGVS